LNFAAATPRAEPATVADFRHYMIVTPLVVSGLWVLLNLVGNYWVDEPL
jgi:hypothetical protein